MPETIVILRGFAFAPPNPLFVKVLFILRGFAFAPPNPLFVKGSVVVYAYIY